VIWLSIDPAHSGPSGYCRWDDAAPVATGIIKPCGNKGAWWSGGVKLERELYAWELAMTCVEAVVIEVGRGSFRNADMPLGKRLGYTRAVCDYHGIAYHELALSEWRRIVREQTGWSWPAGTEGKKALAQRVARERYGLDVSPDAADAVCVGMAWVASGRQCDAGNV
jgi:hypothetical protein